MSQQTAQDFQKIATLSKQAKILEGVSSLLHWDQETQMPAGASSIRAEQLKTVAGLIHKEKTNRKFSSALGKLIDLKKGAVLAKGLSNPQVACLKEWRREYLKAVALPTKFVEDFAKLTSQSLEAWRVAKSENSFQKFAPFLDRIVAMSRKKADLMGYQAHPYDALLDDYEPNMTTQEVDGLFGNLGKSLSTLLKKIVSAKQVEDGFLYGKFDHQKQMQFSQKILDAMGYDMSKGRVDLSSHPFSSSCHPTDSRITTRIHPTSLVSNIFVILHEGGHSLYEMGLPQEHYGSPLCEAISLGVHESQSRWWETRIGQSKSFWKHFLPLLSETFKGKLGGVTLDAFYRAVNKVEPSFIRVEADEVTYGLHVIVRFEIEKALIEGSLSVREIPEAWNAKMKQYLGITPKNDSEGCLQDIHWSMGAFGYFPTYAIGNMYAAQLFEVFEKEHPKWKQQVEQGKLTFIKEWLNEHVHRHGKHYTSKELLKKITGKSFSAAPYMDYLNGKYSEIYK